MLAEETPVHAPSGISGIETRSIDWVPENERHGKLWHQLPLWFLGNFQYFSIPIGFVGPSLGLSLWWTIVAGTTGILTGTTPVAIVGLPNFISYIRSGTVRALGVSSAWRVRVKRTCPPDSTVVWASTSEPRTR